MKMDKQWRVQVSEANDGDDSFDFPDTLLEECLDCDDRVHAVAYAHDEAERGFKAVIYHGNDYIMTVE
jgi:hypothetical protein